MTPAELLRGAPSLKLPPPGYDPLGAEDAFAEGQLVGFLMDVQESAFAALLDLRTAIQLRSTNVAVVVARHTVAVDWTADRRLTPRTAWNVVRSIALTTPSSVMFELEFFPSAALRLEANRIECYLGTIEDLPKAPPDLSGSRRVVERGTPRWSSEIVLVANSWRVPR